MTTMTFADPRLAKLNGFRVELNGEKERADIVLDRPPLNVIEMPQREQLRLVFETLDQDDRARVIVLRAIGEHFSSGGNIKGFLEATPEHVSKLAWNVAAPSRCSKPVIAANRGYCFGVGFEISLLRFSHRFRNLSLCLARAEAWPNSRLWWFGALAEDHRYHANQRHRNAITADPRPAGTRLGYCNRMRSRQQA